MATASTENLSGCEAGDEDAEEVVIGELRQSSERALQERSQRMQEVLDRGIDGRLPDGGKMFRRKLSAVLRELSRRQAPPSSSSRPPTPDPFDKANWSSSNNAIFCDICIEEMRAGNTINGFMTHRAYKNMAEKYFISTGLRHSRVQLKNRWDQLKKLYSFWLWLNKQTGLGRANGTVVASDKFWKEHTKGHSEWKRLKYGPPECLEQLEQIFAHTAVNGSTSCIAGEQMNDEGFQREGLDGSPMGTGTKRASSTSTCATSPMKKVKSHMVKIMKGIWDIMETNNAIARKVMQGDLMTESINKAMQLVVESGAAEGSAEHFVASQLFVKSENRAIFFTLTSNEGRLDWLKRWCKQKNINLNLLCRNSYMKLLVEPVICYLV